MTDDCGFTSVDNCVSDDSDIAGINEYCCNYVLGTPSSNLSQQELFDVITVVRNLNVASLVSDYFFVIMAVSVFIYAIRNKSADDTFSKAATRVLFLSVLGSIIDIGITFAIVGVIDQNGLIDTFFDLYDSECYSSNITLTLLDLKGQFETILILDSVEGVLDIISLCVLFCGHLWENETFRSMSAGIHGFMFAVFDLAIISVNVFVFVLPSYNTFVQSYNDSNYLCFQMIGTMSPTMDPTFQPTMIPTLSPNLAPTNMPSMAPTQSRLYNISMTISNNSYHGVRDLFFRLCSDDTSNCTIWYAAIDGIDVVADTYSLDWKTWDVDDVYFVDIATIGAENWCLKQIVIDSIIATVPNIPVCIKDDTTNGCDAMHIDLVNNSFPTQSWIPCIYDDIVNHASLATTTRYLAVFGVANSVESGSTAPLYFILCNDDKICTDTFEITDGMSDEGKEYLYNIDISNYIELNALYDAYTVDIWTYSTQRFCLSNIRIKANSVSSSAVAPSAECIQSTVDDDVMCSGLTVNMDTNVWQRYDEANCQWNSIKNDAITISEGTLSPTPIPTATTLQPTSNPIQSIVTATPSTAPSTDTLTSKQMQHQQDLDNLEGIYQIVLSLFGCVFGVIAITAFLDVKLFRTNDYFKMFRVPVIALQVLDMLSDCFFAVILSIQYKINSHYFIPFPLAIIFIVIPATTSYVQLYRQKKKDWIYSSDQVRGWLHRRSKALYLLSVLTGNSFAAVSLVNSYIFKLSFFDMGLTDKELAKFLNKRIYSVVLFKNIPQLVLQSWYLISLEAFDDLIIISSIIFSLLSVIVCVLPMLIHKGSPQSGTQSYYHVKMKVTGSVVISNAKSCKTMKKMLEKKIAQCIGVHPSIVEVIKPVPFSGGFEVRLNINISDIHISDSFCKPDYSQILKDAQYNGDLQETFKNGWKLDDKPNIEIISCYEIQSKAERKRSARAGNSIKQNVETQQDEAVQMTAVKRDTMMNEHGTQSQVAMAHNSQE